MKRFLPVLRMVVKRFLVALCIGLLVAVILIPLSGGIGSLEKYEHALLRMMVEEEAERCGVSKEELATASDAQKWLCVNFGIEGYLMGRKDRDVEMSPTLYHLYGEEVLFHKAISLGGHKAIQVIWWFYKNPSAAYEAEDSIGKFFQIFKKRSGESFDDFRKSFGESLSPEVRAWIAIQRIIGSNGAYLAQFYADESGEIKVRSNIKRVFDRIEEGLVGGLENAEVKIKLGQPLSTEEKLNAVGDLALLTFLGANTLLAAKTGMAVLTARSTVTVSRSTRAAFLVRTASSYVPRIGRLPIVVKYGTLGVGGYLLLKNRTAFNSFLGAAADLFGLPRLAFQAAVWTLVIAAPLYMLGWMWFFIGQPIMKWIVNPALRCLIWAMLFAVRYMRKVLAAPDSSNLVKDAEAV